MRVSLSFCLSAILLLCSSAESAQPPKTTYYLIESTMQIPEGRMLPASVALVKRVVDPDKGTIEESVLSLRGSAPAQEFVTIIKPQGNTAKISCANCEFAGEGEFTGEAWAWSGFKFKTRIPTLGQTIEGEDRFSPDGMSADKRVIGSDGRVTVVIKESGRVISEQTYTILHARLMAK